MKSFLVALVALVVIAVGANRILTTIGFSSQEAGTSSANVRLPE